MPRVTANSLKLNYEQQGTGDPLILLPFLSADSACYAFQVAEYAKEFSCISVDLRGTGASDPSPGPYTTEMLADDIAGLMQSLGIPRAHVAGLSLGAGIGIWLAAKYPAKVTSLSLHSAWPKTDLFVKTLIESWQVLAKGYGSVTDLVVNGIFPWCLTPDLYASKPEYIQGLTDFVRSRPEQSLESFIQQSNAVLQHDAEAQLKRIVAPTLVSFGRHDAVTSTRFADRLTSGIRGSELVIFEDCAHAPIYERVEEFNNRTLAFLRRHSGKAVRPPAVV